MDREAGKLRPPFAFPTMNPRSGGRVKRAVSCRGRSDVSKLPGQPARLRSVTKDAAWYSLRFR